MTTSWPLGDHLVTTLSLFCKICLSTDAIHPNIKIETQFFEIQKVNQGLRGRGVGGFVDPVD